MNIKKGVNIIFPIWGIHHNADFFPDPETFMPERFLKENQASVIPFSYLPFGGGPRKCIGSRFAMAEMKIGLAKLLHNYQIFPVPQTKLDFYTGDPSFLSYSDVEVKIMRRN